MCHSCGRRRTPEQSGEGVSPEWESDVSSVRKTGGVASQAGAAPGVKAKATGKGSDRAETATGRNVPEELKGTEGPWKARDRKWENWYGWGTGWASESRD